ncbi:Putative toxin component near putative ESAT-related protein, repetitive [Bacillus mycoides]|uniref:T7SS effector LXG polymorphic toxin n=1 Tax=Bacillus mycoides TaxID=1405 RepID=UPI0005E3A5BB|nr:T7SS effector LXG polymorphic toxin [Bacillus mycoides]KIV72543.1 Putative toxin component near putative ESAT-related protein, repetitive [Bacillus mycoides]
MGFQVDLKEFNEILAKLQKDTSKTNEQLEQAKNALNGIIQADAMQGATGNAIVNDINNNQNTVVIGLKNTNELLIAEMSTTLQDFQSTTGESHENAVILEDALLQAQNKLSNLQPKKHEMDSRISNIYNSVSDLISLSMPNSQFDEKLVAASKELEDTIQKVQQFESKKEKSDAENILNALNNQVQIAGKMGSLSYTDPHLQAFFALDDLAKGIHEMDTQITKAKKEAQLQAEREMKKKQEEWADNHPVEAWLQNFSNSAGEKWDVLRKGTEWVGENIPFLKGLADDALVLEGFLGAAGSAISGIAIGATKLFHLALELGEWGYNSMRGVETEQWKLDDISGAGNTLKNLGQAIISWQDYPKYGKALVNSVKGYVEKALTDPYALGGAIFDIGSCFVGVGEVTAAVKGTAAFGKFAEGTKVFQVAAKNSKIVGKLEEVTALMNKLPSSIVEKIKNIEIPNVFPEPALAGIGKSGGGGLDSLKDAYQFMKETGEKVFGKGTGEDKVDYGKLKEKLNERYKDFVNKKNERIPQTSDTYLENELNHGKFGELPEVKGDNITGHHMPSNKYMNDKYSIETDESYAINLEHPHPGRGGRHRRTFTYGLSSRTRPEDFKLYMSLKPRDALAFDVNDLRRILKEDGLYNKDSRERIREYIEYYKNYRKNDQEDGLKIFKKP